MAKSDQLALKFEHRPAMGGEDFLVTPCNEAAVGWIDRWPDWPSTALILVGPPASGKTHLAMVFQNRTKAVEMDMAEIDAEMPADVRAMVVENVDRRLNPEREEGLLHLINQAGEQKISLLLTAEKPPSRWDVKLADLRSRLNAQAAVEIGRPDDALIEAVMVKLFHERQIDVPREVVAYLRPRMERSLDSVRRLVEAMDTLSLQEKRGITVPLARRILRSGEEYSGS